MDNAHPTNGLLFATNTPRTPHHHLCPDSPRSPIVRPLSGGRLPEPLTGINLGQMPLVNTGHSFALVPLPNVVPVSPVSLYPAVHPQLAIDAANNVPQLSWDLAHCAHTIHPGVVSCRPIMMAGRCEGQVLSEPVLQTNEYFSRMIVKVRYFDQNQDWIRDVDIRSRGILTVGDLISNIADTAQTPLCKEELKEVHRQGRYTQACNQVIQRIQDPQANQDTRLVAVDLLGEHRYFRGLKVNRWSETKDAWVMTLYVGTRIC